MTAVKSLSPPTLRRLRFEVTSYTFYTWERNLDTARYPVHLRSNRFHIGFFSFYPIFGDFFWSQQAKLLYYIRIPPDGDIELVW